MAPHSLSGAAGIGAAPCGDNLKLPAGDGKVRLRLEAVAFADHPVYPSGKVDISPALVGAVGGFQPVVLGIHVKAAAGDYQGILPHNAVFDRGDMIIAAADAQVVLGLDAVVVVCLDGEGTAAVEGQVVLGK